MVSKIPKKHSGLPPRVILLSGALLVLAGIGAVFSASTYESFSLTLKLSEGADALLPLLASFFTTAIITTAIILASSFVLNRYPLLSKKKKFALSIAIGIITFLVLFLITKHLVTKSLIYPSNYFYFWRQIVNIGIAFLAGVVVYFFPLRGLTSCKFILVVSIVIILLQLAVFLPEPIGTSLKGARGRINIGFRTLQPAEFFKLGYVIFLARWLIRKKQRIRQQTFFVHFILLHILLSIIFVLIPDMGSLIVMGMTGIIMMRYAGAKFQHILMLFFGGLGGLLLAIGLLTAVSDKYDYILDRFASISPISQEDQKREAGRQNYQALIAIGGGGFRGEGYGKGLQKFRNLPEAQSDFIFAAISEEIGFIGNLGLLGLYILLAISFLQNISRKEHKHVHIKLLGVGILSLILLQVFVNIGVNLKILPNTGLTLPFISHGGTAILINVIEVVLLYKIASFLQRQKRGLKNI